MLTYFIILLDDTSTSYCHYSIPQSKRNLISYDNLKSGVLFAMKENLTVQFVYPDYDLPKEYEELIETVEHVRIKPSFSPSASQSDIVVFESIEECISFQLENSKPYVLRLSKEALFHKETSICESLSRVARLNIVITDLDSFTEKDFNRYKYFLSRLGKNIEKLYLDEKSPQVNLLTDRLHLRKMNNCDAGDSSIVLAPDGRFYICPAFYYEKAKTTYMGLGGPSEAPFSVGDLASGLRIKNKQLYKIDHAPICRLCDAYQCKRCIWMNWKTTMDVNTPSHEQCVVAHLERNASRNLLHNVRRYGDFLPGKKIKKIAYLDPFDLIEK